MLTCISVIEFATRSSFTYHEKPKSSFPRSKAKLDGRDLVFVTLLDRFAEAREFFFETLAHRGKLLIGLAKPALSL
jgi:hypothetical protein